MAQVDILRENKDQVKQMRLDGIATKTIGAMFNVTNDVVKTFCKDNGIKTQEQRNSEEEAARRIKDKTEGQFIYVSGYTNKEGKVKVKCADCGEIFERTYHHLTTHRNNCPCCDRNAREYAKAKQEADKQARAEQRRIAKEEREAEKKKKSEAWKNRPYHKCMVCGTLTQNPKYCSPDCRNKATWATKEHRRRARLKVQMVDKDITVEGLFRRDKGICSICGKRCDLEDYTVREGVFIAGDWYPSIDHVKPISKGGLHSWGNVQLAHRRCNTLKSDKESD